MPAARLCGHPHAQLALRASKICVYGRSSMADTLTITDNRTGKQYELPIHDGTIRAMDLRQIKTAADDFGLMTYDPAFMNTANCRSALTVLDGDKRILLYRA